MVELKLSRRVVADHVVRLSGIVTIFAIVLLSSLAIGQERTTRIGVLAYRGTAVVFNRWQPLAGYLTTEIPGARFKLVPVTLISAVEQLKANQLDFVITNPGHFVTLAEYFPLSALATQERREAGQRDGLLRFGTVIFVRADRTDIQTLADLKDKTLVAVSPEAFGGFQMAWYEFRQQGIDPFKDLKEIRYKGFPQDEIVTEVLTGSADAGVVRTGLLETLAHEGRVRLGDLKVLQGNAQTNFPYLVSSRLYPEWPFAVREGTEKTLMEAVTLALLKTQDRELAKRYNLTDLWSAPLSYDGVRAVISKYRADTNEADSAIGFDRTPVFLIMTVLALIGGFAVGYLLKLRIAVAGMPAFGLPGAGDRKAEARRARFEKLTRREREVLSLICRGEPTKQIAETLHISPKTVEYHRSNLLHKTSARSTARMVQLATRYGFDKASNLGESRS